MRLPPVSLLLVLGSTSLVMAGLTPAHAGGGLPVCNAKHKRPANLYGSVLSDGLKPVVADAAAGSAVKSAAGAPAGAAAAVAKRPQISVPADLKASFAPCGAGARA